MLDDWLKIRVVLVVKEGNLFLCVYGGVDGVYIVKDRIALAFHAAVHVHTSAQSFPLVHAGERCHLLAQAVGCLLGKEATGLHGVGKKRKFGKVEPAFFHRVFQGHALNGVDGAPKFTQDIQVAVNALALGRYTFFFKLFQNLSHGKTVFGIGLFVKHLIQVEKFEFLLAVGCHAYPLIIALKRQALL